MMAQKLCQSSIFFSIFLLIILMMTPKSTSAPNLLTYMCPNDTMFANNSQYQANLNTLFRYLSSNATNPNGFHQAASSTGNTANDKVYGHFLCRGDQNISSCRDCVNTATTTDLPRTHCPNRKDAIIWYEECMVRYSNRSYFGQLDDSTWWIYWNSHNISGNATQFMDLMNNMMNNQVAVRAALGGSQKKFAANFVNYTSSQTIYGLGQCTPDLSSSDCNTCLTGAVAKFRESKGGRILLPSCVVRYEVYIFFELSSLPPRTNSTQSSGNVTDFTVLNNCNYSVWPAIFDSSGGDTVPTKFYLQQGESTTINVNASWAGSVWGRTLCLFDQVIGNFSCQTGDCGNGDIECQGNSVKGPITKAEFRIGQIQNQDMYDISIKTGYNLPMMVIPQGGSGVKCVPTGCVFNLDETTCPSEFSIDGEDSSTIIACQNPCYAQDCCKTGVLCQSSDYSNSSRVFGKLCPRANINPSDLSSTTFICERQSYRTSYNITFCPSPEMTSVFSRPFQTPSGQVSRSPSQSPSSLPVPTATPTINLPKNTTGRSKRRSTILLVALSTSATVSILLFYGVWTCMRKRKVIQTSNSEASEIKKAALDSLQFDLKTIQAATNNFSTNNKLGEGGFGEVYKGILENGQEIAVKRLSKNSSSGQGDLEFKTEVILVAKLRHKNLVKLLGFCVELKEKLIVYEFLPKSSLDRLLFDPRRQEPLDWQTRFNIIVGIARGLLYLHEDSPLKVIHRDLKSSNILLDEHMNPKIADFGLAKLFGVDQTQGDTKRIIGTYGYMAPEYAITGQYSVKSDVYSFGVLVLEIVSGQRSRFFGGLQLEEALLHRAWRLWNEDQALDLVDRTLSNEFPREEVIKCIHIGLLCIQEDSIARPRMRAILGSLNGQENNLPLPKPPNFFGTTVNNDELLHNSGGVYTGTNTITDLYPRD